MSSLSPAQPRGANPLASLFPQTGLLGRLTSWLDAIPHPPLACEIAATHVAAARWTGQRRELESYALEPLPAGALVPSPVEGNFSDAAAVRAGVERVLTRVGAEGEEIALLVPDPVVRVFILHFDTLPRRAEETIPLLRWRLKKSVPFDVEATVVSYMTQPAREQGVDAVVALARQQIVRQYEELAEAAGATPGVVLSSTLAALPLLEESHSTLLARLSGTTLTTVIVRGSLLSVYRSTEVPADAASLEPQALLEEIYPAVAFYQDTWKENVQQIRLAGLGARFDEFRGLLETELGAMVRPFVASSALEARLTGEAKALVDRQLDSLVGWMLNRAV